MSRLNSSSTVVLASSFSRACFTLYYFAVTSSRHSRYLDFAMFFLPEMSLLMMNIVRALPANDMCLSKGPRNDPDFFILASLGKV